MATGSQVWASSLAGYFQDFVPYAVAGYFALLGVARLIKVLHPKIQVGHTLQFWHNIFLSLQSALLMVLIYLLYTDTQAIEANKGRYYHPIYNVFQLLTQAQSRNESVYFEICLICFLASKLYEAIDTVILILNNKPLLMLHVWHHATTYLAFYTGLFTGAGCWIGMLNSFIHVIMYMYYAKVPGIKSVAVYITSMQIFHLLGGAVLNAYTAAYPIENMVYRGVAIDVSYYSKLNFGLCFSYFFLFLAFFSKKYHKNGSIYSVFMVPKGTQKSIYTMQKKVFGEGVEKYLIAQGLLVPSGVVEGGEKKKE